MHLLARSVDGGGTAVCGPRCVVITRLPADGPELRRQVSSSASREGSHAAAGSLGGRRCPQRRRTGRRLKPRLQHRPGHRPACPGQTPRRPLPHADAGVDPPEPHGLRRQLTGSRWQDVGSRRCPRTLKSQAQGARELGALRAPRGAAAAGGPSPATFASVHFGLDSGEGNEVSLARAMCSPQPEEGPS